MNIKAFFFGGPLAGQTRNLHYSYFTVTRPSLDPLGRKIHDLYTSPYSSDVTFTGHRIFIFETKIQRANDRLEQATQQT